MKKISVFLVLTMLLSLCTAFAAEDVPDYSDMSKIIILHNNSVPEGVSAYVEDPFMLVDGNFIYSGPKKGYNAMSHGGTFTLKNVAESDKYFAYLTLVPLYPDGEGGYTNVYRDEKNGKKYREYYYRTTDGDFAIFDKNPMYEDRVLKLKRGESVEFSLPEKISRGDAEMIFPEDMMWIIAVSTIHGQYVNYLRDGVMVKAFNPTSGDTGYTSGWFVKTDEKTIEKRIAGVKDDIRFTDVKPTDYFYEPVEWALSKEITNGTGNRTFSPHNTCTQAQILTFLWRSQGCPESDHKLIWIDQTKYYATAFKWAAEKGLIAGKVEPDSPCARIDVVRYMYLLEKDAKAEANLANKFTDVSPEDKPIVAWALERGITNGSGVNTFSPRSTCTRGQIVTFLWRAYAK